MRLYPLVSVGATALKQAYRISSDPLEQYCSSLAVSVCRVNILDLLIGRDFHNLCFYDLEQFACCPNGKSTTTPRPQELVSVWENQAVRVTTHPTIVCALQVQLTVEHA